MNKKPLFEVGQTIVATGSYMWQLTEGKKYVVTKYVDECPEPWNDFTWPAYVIVIGDFGTPVAGLAQRFRALKEEEK